MIPEEKETTWRKMDPELDRLEQERIRSPAEEGEKGAGKGAREPTEKEASAERTPKTKNEAARERLIDDPCGLALSGGGIRSATFNLGVLQALAEEEVLGGFHYLSTVSGGGYIGGFWSAWRRRCTEKDEKDKAFPSTGNRHVRHLRNFSNFLRPRLSLVSFETGRMVTALLVGIIPTLLVTCGVLMGALLAWLGIAWLLMEPPVWTAALLWGVVLLAALILFQVAWNLWSDEEEEFWERVAFYFLLVVIPIASVFLWGAIWHVVPLPVELRVAPVSLDEVGTAHWVAAILPTVGLLLPALVLILVRSLLTWVPGRGERSSRLWRRRVFLTSLESAIDRLLFLGLVWLVIGVLWVGGQVVAGSGVSGVVGALSVSGTGGGIFFWLRRFLRAQPNKPGGGRTLVALGTSSIQVVAYLTLTAMVLLVAALVSGVLGAFGTTGLWSLVAITVILLVYPRFFDPREMAFHSFYRQRLARAYLGAASEESCRGSGGDKDRATLECSTDDMVLDDLPPGAPLHLICCAANDLAGDPIESLHRGAKSAVLSAVGIQVGGRWRRWKQNSDDDKASEEGDGDAVASKTEAGKAEGPPAPSLSSAMTASAAAFNSHMGSKSMRLGQAATFLLTALNLRLGLWIDNPAKKRKGVFDRLPPFYRELFGFSDLRASEVHLSDGAHFENLALYELVRRRCRFILVSDCGADPDYAFDDLANAIRRIRTDFGAEINIDPAPLRPSKESGRARQAVVAGTIRYRSLTLEENPEGEKNPKTEEGIVILVKPTLVGDEPADVLQYAGRNEEFPQESTTDQFYDEAQWEAYRRLGQHAVENALKQVAEESSRSENSLLNNDEPVDVTKLRWFLAQGQFQWAPYFEVDPGQLAQMEERWAHLEDGLARDVDAEELATQVLSEFPPSERKLQKVSIGPARHIRSAVHLMESVLRIYALDREQIHPDQFGWVNRFGRWVRTQEFVLVWLFLSPTLSRRLKRFLEKTFHPHLPKLRSQEHIPGQERILGSVKKAEDKKDGEWSGRYVFYLETGESEAAGSGKKQKKHKKQKKQKKHKKQKKQKKLEVGEIKVTQKEGVIVWENQDFKIEPGFWGCGFADRFLRAFCEKLLEEHGALDGQEKGAGARKPLELRVNFKKPVTPTDIALDPTDIALYAGVGFRIHGNKGTRMLKLEEERKPAADSEAANATDAEEPGDSSSIQRTI